MTDLQTPPVINRKIQILRLLGVAIVAGILGAWAVLGFHALLQFLESQLYGQNKGLVAASMRLSFVQRLMMPALGGVVAGLILRYLLGKNKKGFVGLYVDIGTIGYFKDLKVIKKALKIKKEGEKVKDI